MDDVGSRTFSHANLVSAVFWWHHDRLVAVDASKVALHGGSGLSFDRATGHSSGLLDARYPGSL